MAFQKKVYFTLLVGRVIGLHCRCSKISGNILKDFGKVDTLLLKLVNKRGLNNLDKTAYGAESPSNYLLSVSKYMLLQIYRSFILFTYISLNVIPYCSGRCQDKWEKKAEFPVHFFSPSYVFSTCSSLFPLLSLEKSIWKSISSFHAYIFNL